MIATFYDVEWISVLPQLSPEEGEGSDFDRATYATRRFPSRPLALAFARRIIRNAPIGAAKVTPVCRVSAERVKHDDDLVSWREGGEWWGECGPAEEVA